MSQENLVQRIADAYYASLRHTSVHQPKGVVLFSGVPGSGKSTIAKNLEETFRAVRINNDDIRLLIATRAPELSLQEREDTKLKVSTAVLERIGQHCHNLVIIDASCDRGYDYYKSWARTYRYPIVLLRMDVPRSSIEQRLAAREQLLEFSKSDMLAHVDAWWQNWEAFGRQHHADLIITPSTPIDDVHHIIRKRLY